MSNSYSAGTALTLLATLVPGTQSVTWIEGRLTRAGRAGTWRFELGSNLRLEPGSIRVLSGEPAVVTGDAILFRLRGQPGEQIAFTFRLKR